MKTINPINPITSFSRHALKRIDQRCKLTETELTGILDSGLFVDLGIEAGNNRHHLLCFSEIDNEFFVAIQDRFIGRVVTVLPLDYHKNLEPAMSRKITESSKEEARNMIIESNKVDVVIPRIWVSALYLDDTGNQKVKQITKDGISVYHAESERITNKSKLVTMITDKGISIDSVHGLSIRLGKNATPIFVEL